MIRCNICNKKVKDIIEHMKRKHIGRISRQSYEYLVSLGIDNLGERLAGRGVKAVLVDSVDEEAG